MQLVEKHIIKKSDPSFKEIDALAFASKNLFNLANYNIRQNFFATGAPLGWGVLDKMLQQTDAYKALPAKVSQLVLKNLVDNWEAYLKAHAEWEQNPHRFNGEPRIIKYKDKVNGRNLL